MFSWIKFLNLDSLLNFLLTSLFELLVNPHSISSKNTSTFYFTIYFSSWNNFRFNIIQGRCEVHIDISIDNANSIILIVRIYFQNINLKSIIKHLNTNRIPLMQTSKISQLILQYSLWVLHLNELCLMRLQFDHMPYTTMLLLHVLDQSNSAIWTRLWKFQHLEHPLRNITETFLSDKLKDTAICHFRAIFYAENHRVFVATAHHEVKLVKSRSRKQDFIAFVYVLTIG